MTGFRKMLLALIFVAISLAVATISVGRQVCDSSGQHCFDYQPLPPVENKTTPMQLPPDPPLKPQPRLAPGGGSGTGGVKSDPRSEVLKALTADCTKAGGILEVKESKARCLPRPAR